VKRNQKLLARGNYDQSIELAIKKLQKDKYAEKNEEHILLLEEAFTKAVERDQRRISFLKKENTLQGLREVYYLYDRLENRQELIIPLLPLEVGSKGRGAKIKIEDYSDALLAAKKRFGDKLYVQGEQYLRGGSKMDARKAYDVLNELAQLNLRPQDGVLANMLEEAIFKGTDFVFVSLNNRSGQIIPRRLEQELLDFNTYGLDHFWTEYHTERRNDLRYDFGIALNFRQIDFSPERIAEREERRTKRIKDGWEYKKDREGNIVKDENGDPIKLDIYKTVTAVLRITEQNKAAIVGGDVIFRDLEGRRDIDKFPLGTEFIFENVFATYSGDERALTDDDLILTRNRFVRFPSNSEMLLDAGDDIKARLKAILNDNHF
jgi:hypothetical protein